MPQQFAFTLSVLAMLFYVSTQGSSDAYFETLPGYAITSIADLLNSTMCGKELKDFRDAIDQQILWSLKVLDSSGGFKPGFLYGNNYWLGSRKQCLDTMNSAPLQLSERTILNNTLYRDSQKEFPPFKVNYFVAHFKHNSTLQYHINMFEEDVITLGLCLPASCPINNISFILEKMFRDKIILNNDLYFEDIQLIQVKDLKNDSKWLSSGALSFICVPLGLSLFLVITGTIYDIIMHQKCVKKNGTNKINSNAENISEEIEAEINLSSHRESKIKKVLICFSAYTNTRKMLSTKLDAGTIPAMHGLKFLSMCCIILSHCVYFIEESIDNKAWGWRILENYGAYIFDISILSVDTYFFLSGCLVTYLYLKNGKNEGPIKPIACGEKLNEFFIHIIKRFIRLTPAYIIVLGIWQLSSAWFDKISQFYMYDKSHETCAKYWWRNLLYINNLFDTDSMCMIWSWYLASDMQFYIIATTLLILSTIYFYVAVTILGALLIGSITISGYLSYIYEYVPTFDEQRKLQHVLYFPPWTRINPYIIGMITGYILTKLNNNLFLKKKIIVLCWCLASACNIFVLFVLYKRHISVLTTAIYVALHKILWVTGIAWIVIACSTKHGGIVNQILSFKGWIPLSRLSYCAYLLNPVIIRSICLYRETSIHFEFLSEFVMSIGYIAITYFCSYALYLMIEVPYILLMKMFIQYFNGRQNRYPDSKMPAACRQYASKFDHDLAADFNLLRPH